MKETQRSQATSNRKSFTPGAMSGVSKDSGCCWPPAELEVPTAFERLNPKGTP